MNNTIALRSLPSQWRFSPRPVQGTTKLRSLAAGFSSLQRVLFNPEKDSPSVRSSSAQTAVSPPKKKKKKKSKKPATSSPDAAPAKCRAEANAKNDKNDKKNKKNKNDEKDRNDKNNKNDKNDENDKKKKKEKREKALALARRFDDYFGAEDLSDWQRLCRDLDLGEFSTKVQCRKALRTVHVNIEDLLDAANVDKEVQRFESRWDLARYCRKTGKIYPKDKAKESGPVADLLRKIG